jgi:integrase
MDTTYLKKRGQSYYVQLVVPAALRSAVGKHVLVKALGTRDVREANTLKHSVLAELHRDLTRASLAQTLGTIKAPPTILDVARGQRRAVAEGTMADDTAEAGFEAHLDGEIERLRRERGFDPHTGEPYLTPADRQALDLAEKVMAGGDVELLSESITKYLAEAGKRIRIQTLEEKRKDLVAFSTWLGQDLDVSDVTRKLAGKYVTDWLGSRGLAAATLKKTLSNLTSFFTWLQGRGVLEANPFALMARTVSSSTRGEAPLRRPFTDAEALQLVKTLKASDPLLPLVMLGAYTGMRREEIAGLKVSDVEHGALTVRFGKSRSAVRSVPVHPVIKGLVDQLAATTTDAYLIPGLLTGGRDHRRGHFAGKRFSRLLRAAGLKDKALVFHSLRKSFVSRCEAAAIPESTTKLLVGHSRRSSLTYGDLDTGYSPGLQLDALKKAIAKITYGPLDALVRKLSGTVKVTKKSARRPSAKKLKESIT